MGGCWFHYAQAIQTWFSKNRVGHNHETNYYANIAKSYIICLPWIPIKFVREYWSKTLIPLIRKAFNNSSSSALIGYINSTWFSRFQPEIWNIHNKPVWTNNYIENSNKFLNDYFGNHPNKEKFIE